MKSGCLAGYLASCCSQQYKPETGPCCTNASRASGLDLETTKAPGNRMPAISNSNNMAAAHRACFYALVTLNGWLYGCTCLVRTGHISEIWLLVWLHPWGHETLYGSTPKYEKVIQRKIDRYWYANLNTVGEPESNLSVHSRACAHNGDAMYDQYCLCLMPLLPKVGFLGHEHPVEYLEKCKCLVVPQFHRTRDSGADLSSLV